MSFDVKRVENMREMQIIKIVIDFIVNLYLVNAYQQNKYKGGR